jgi:hypothetical protein
MSAATECSSVTLIVADSLRHQQCDSFHKIQHKIAKWSGAVICVCGSSLSFFPLRSIFINTYTPFWRQQGSVQCEVAGCPVSMWPTLFTTLFFTGTGLIRAVWHLGTGTYCNITIPFYKWPSFNFFIDSYTVARSLSDSSLSLLINRAGTWLGFSTITFLFIGSLNLLLCMAVECLLRMENFFSVCPTMYINCPSVCLTAIMARNVTLQVGLWQIDAKFSPNTWGTSLKILA